MNDKPITVITVLCDPKRVQTIALTCRHGHRWTERIPGEIHDSALMARFKCPTCGSAYILKDHKFIREEDFHGGQEQTHPTTGQQFKFDA